MTLDLLVALAPKLGHAGKNQPIVGGALVFLVAGLGVGYLAFVRDEMDAGLVMKSGTVLLFGLAVLAFFWPHRPWPH